MTEMSGTTSGPPARTPLLPILALFVALLGVALGAAAIAVAAGDDTDTVRLPAVMTEHMATMTEQMGMGMGMGMGTMDVDAMRDRCVSMVGARHAVEDPEAFCDSMIGSMPMPMSTAP